MKTSYMSSSSRDQSQAACLLCLNILHTCVYYTRYVLGVCNCALHVCECVWIEIGLTAWADVAAVELKQVMNLWPNTKSKHTNVWTVRILRDCSCHFFSCYHMGHRVMVSRSELSAEMKSSDVLLYKWPFSYSDQRPTGLNERHFIHDRLCCSLSTFKVASGCRVLSYVIWS